MQLRIYACAQVLLPDPVLQLSVRGIEREGGGLERDEGVVVIQRGDRGLKRTTLP